MYVCDAVLRRRLYSTAEGVHSLLLFFPLSRVCFLCVCLLVVVCVSSCSIILAFTLLSDYVDLRSQFFSNPPVFRYIFKKKKNSVFFGRATRASPAQ